MYLIILTLIIGFCFLTFFLTNDSCPKDIDQVSKSPCDNGTLLEKDFCSLFNNEVNFPALIANFHDFVNNTVVLSTAEAQLMRLMVKTHLKANNQSNLLKLKNISDMEDIINSRKDLEIALRREGYLDANYFDLANILEVYKIVNVTILPPSEEDAYCTLLNYIRPIDTHRLMYLIKIAEEIGEKFEGKRVLVPIGFSGSGKSTFIHAMSGSSFCTKVINGKARVFPYNIRNSEANDIIVSYHTRSQTRYAQPVTTSLSQLSGDRYLNSDSIQAVDAPGFDDNRDVVVEISNGFGFVRSLQGTSKVYLVLAFTQSDLHPRFNNLGNLMKILRQFFKDNVHEHALAINYLFTSGFNSLANPQSYIYNQVKETRETITADEKLINGFEKLLRDLEERIPNWKGVFLFDLERSFWSHFGGNQLKPVDILKKILEGKSIDNPKEVFSPYLSANAINLLKKQVEILKFKINTIINAPKIELSLIHFHLTVLRQLAFDLNYEGGEINFKAEYASIIATVVGRVVSIVSQAQKIFQKELLQSHILNSEKQIKEFWYTVSNYSTILTFATESDAQIQNFYSDDKISQLFKEHFLIINTSISDRLQLISSKNNKSDLEFIQGLNFNSARAKLDRINISAEFFPEFKSLHNDSVTTLNKSLLMVNEIAHDYINVWDLDEIISILDIFESAYSNLAPHNIGLVYLQFKTDLLNFIKEKQNEIERRLVPHTVLNEADWMLLNFHLKLCRDLQRQSYLVKYFLGNEIRTVIEEFHPKLIDFGNQTFEALKAKIEDPVSSLADITSLFNQIDGIFNVSSAMGILGDLTLTRIQSQADKKLGEYIASFEAKLKENLEKVLHRSATKKSNEDLTNALNQIPSFEWMSSHADQEYGNLLKSIKQIPKAFEELLDTTNSLLLHYDYPENSKIILEYYDQVDFAEPLQSPFSNHFKEYFDNKNRSLAEILDLIREEIVQKLQHGLESIERVTPKTFIVNQTQFYIPEKNKGLLLLPSASICNIIKFSEYVKSSTVPRFKEHEIISNFTQFLRSYQLEGSTILDDCFKAISQNEQATLDEHTINQFTQVFNNRFEEVTSLRNCENSYDTLYNHWSHQFITFFNEAKAKRAFSPLAAFTLWNTLKRLPSVQIAVNNDASFQELVSNLETLVNDRSTLLKASVSTQLTKHQYLGAQETLNELQKLNIAIHDTEQTINLQAATLKQLVEEFFLPPIDLKNLRDCLMNMRRLNEIHQYLSQWLTPVIKEAIGEKFMNGIIEHISKQVEQTAKIDYLLDHFVLDQIEVRLKALTEIEQLLDIASISGIYLPVEASSTITQEKELTNTRQKTSLRTEIDKLLSRIDAEAKRRSKKVFEKKIYQYPYEFNQIKIAFEKVLTEREGFYLNLWNSYYLHPARAQLSENLLALENNTNRLSEAELQKHFRDIEEANNKWSEPSLQDFNTKVANIKADLVNSDTTVKNDLTIQFLDFEGNVDSIFNLLQQAQQQRLSAFNEFRKDLETKISTIKTTILTELDQASPQLVNILKDLATLIKCDEANQKHGNFIIVIPPTITKVREKIHETILLFLKKNKISSLQNKNLNFQKELQSVLIVIRFFSKLQQIKANQFFNLLYEQKNLPVKNFEIQNEFHSRLADIETELTELKLNFENILSTNEIVKVVNIIDFLTMIKADLIEISSLIEDFSLRFSAASSTTTLLEDNNSFSGLAATFQKYKLQNLPIDFQSAKTALADHLKTNIALPIQKLLIDGASDFFDERKKKHELEIGYKIILKNIDVIETFQNYIITSNQNDPIRNEWVKDFSSLLLSFPTFSKILTERIQLLAQKIITIVSKLELSSSSSGELSTMIEENEYQQCQNIYNHFQIISDDTSPLLTLKQFVIRQMNEIVTRKDQSIGLIETELNRLKLESISLPDQRQNKLKDVAKLLIALNQLRFIHFSFELSIDKKIKYILQHFPKDDIYLIGQNLQSSEDDGYEITQREYEFFQANLNELRKTETKAVSFESAAQSLKTTDEDIRTDLFFHYQRYQSKYQELLNDQLKASGGDYINKKLLPALKKKISSGIVDRNQILWEEKTKDLAYEILPYVTAIKTLLSNERSWEPHPVQLLSIFSIFECKLYSSEMGKQLLRNHLLQIGTGEGKSVTLGILSAIFGLFGYEVHIVCYSEYLSRRDRKDFQSLFTTLGLTMGEDIEYGTFYSLFETNINRENDLREIISHVIRTDQDYVKPYSFTAMMFTPEKKPKILLIDEVDVFLSTDFYSATYDVNSKLNDEIIVLLMQYIWEESKKQSHLAGKSMEIGIFTQTLKNSQAYQNCLQSYPNWKFKLDSAIMEMIEAVFLIHQGKVTTYHYDSQLKSIGYKVNDGINYKINQGYETDFLYFLIFDQHFEEQQQKGGSASGNYLTFEDIKGKVGLNVESGQFLYQRLLDNYIGFFGVTGTLSILTGKQKNKLYDLFRNQIGVNSYIVPTETEIPSAYSDRSLRFSFNKKENANILIVKNKNDYHSTLFNEITLRMTATTTAAAAATNAVVEKRAVIVFFEYKESLIEFYKYSRDKLPTDYYLQTMLEEDSESERNLAIRKAVKAGWITLAVRDYGRGTDFICFNSELKARGGVHVLQTFFSLERSEQIQIEGRTARNNNKGSYSMVLLQEELINTLGFTAQDIDNMQSKGTVYEELDKRREELIDKRVDQLVVSPKAVEIHVQSMNLLKGKVHDIKEFIRNAVNARIVYSYSNKRIVIAIDYSGSMSGNKIKTSVANLLHLFDNVIYTKDQVALVLFSTGVSDLIPIKVKENHEEEFRKAISSLTNPDGATALYDAVMHSIAILSQPPSQTTESVDDWIFLLTDGADVGSKANKDTVTKKLQQTNINMLVVGIGRGVETSILMDIAKASTKYGKYFSADEDKKSIEEAFARIGTILQSKPTFNK